MSNDISIWDIFVSMFWFMLLFAWIMLLFHIIADIFRDRELGGGAKAIWCLFLILIPWLGALVYLIVRGNSMAQRSVQATQENEANMRAYVRDAAGTPSAADELAKLAGMRDSGTITPEDYEKAKAKVLA
jgi:hypothetical protein